ncbi:RNA methyltransferase [Thermosynechococcaceae cyanobacterium BACA0444]|uniref:tRNA (cytidine/uridine-2'-O-)-methyltransferase TrmJ n=1 Tax=Pseudocalidococcus azoricus BACA0444 TaxID=2918990 RepID=A0AAE4FT07_9CYAN|nr:RNA methyltransferase [Pseudocalidococcus azoricus]MDS3861768.1 RNA methyltransferase [Pseudocalidococcus azoricus BACA0444]
MSPLGQIKIVLVEPAGALNVGSVARVMKNMGLGQLVLVNPRCDPLGEQARLMAVHGAEILETAQIVEDLPTALIGCSQIMATVGRDLDTDIPLETPRQALPDLLRCPAAIIFGREDHGLTNQEVMLAQRLIQIPTSSTYPSLNLAQAVGVCCYELWQAQADQSALGREQSGQSPSTASFEDLEGFYGHWQSLLLKIGYLYPHTAPSRMAKLRGLVNRSQPTAAEIALLRGMLRQVSWAIEHLPSQR